MIDLKPCPFCGAKAKIELVFVPVNWGDDDLIFKEGYVAECGNGDCDVSPVTNEMSTKEEVIEAWNSRINNMVLNFGNGSIAITPAILEEIPCILLNKQKAHEVGDMVDTKSEWHKNPLVRLNFSNKKSVDVFIRNLERLKRFMGGNFDGENIQEAANDKD